jgi:DNA recombination protein RmuC
MTFVLIGAVVFLVAVVAIVFATKNAQTTVVGRLELLDRTAEKVGRSVEDGFAGNRRETAEAVQRLGDSLVRSQAALGQAQANQLDAFAGQLATATKTTADELSKLRLDVTQSLQTSAATTTASVADLSRISLERVDALASSLTGGMASLESKSTTQLTALRQESQAASVALKDNITTALVDATTNQGRRLSDFTVAQNEQWNGFRSQVDSLRSGVESKLDALRTAVDQRLRDIQQDNAKRLDEMRLTVDEKLQSTLETRLGQSFKQVSERLEQVYKGLGEMQALATGVGDLKRVLTNVKARGTWGEIQLATLLEQVLAPEQYGTNVNTSDTGSERVEFAIRLPGRNGSDESPTWLPIDSKFPLEDYQALVEASERADLTGIEDAGRRLELRVKASAKEISTKYLNPPKTTEFAVMFLPNEGLYAEVLRRPGLSEFVQREHRIVVAGPTTLWAILNSLQMGFRTLAIERRSSEVWNLLGAVKTEFGKFGTVLDAVQKNLQRASSKIDEARKGTRAIERRLTDVGELPQADAAALLDGILPGATDAREIELEHV